MGEPMGENVLNDLFLEARTYRQWQDRPVDEETVKRLYALLKMGPTSGNCLPGRFVFVMSREAKEKLKPVLDTGNIDKTMTAPVTVIVAHDSRFYEYLPELFPHKPQAKSSYEQNPVLAETTAFRNGTLQGAYLILAARALGLDCGPMSGFDNAALDRIFFPDGRWKSNFLVNLGYGDPAGLHPRGPRLEFERACRIE